MYACFLFCVTPPPHDVYMLKLRSDHHTPFFVPFSCDLWVKKYSRMGPVVSVVAVGKSSTIYARVSTQISPVFGLELTVSTEGDQGGVKPSVYIFRGSDQNTALCVDIILFRNWM